MPREGGTATSVRLFNKLFEEKKAVVGVHVKPRAERPPFELGKSRFRQVRFYFVTRTF